VRVLLLYPAFPSTFWSFKYALAFVRKRAAFPPLGLLTVAAMLPDSWELKLVDGNIRALHDADLSWADMVMISAMTVQREEARRMIARCKQRGLRVVAGGPLFTIEHADFDEVDHLVLDEAETSLPAFLDDLDSGEPRHIYRGRGHPDLAETPIPRWDLAEIKRYATLGLQYSRGCPFACEFCDVTALFGRRTRTKSAAQVVAELDAIHALGWRGAVFFVDDNFIGDRLRVKRELLPELERWRADKPSIAFLTEASLDLADDPDLMQAMVRSGFDTVFVGIESPDESSLAECGKNQNRGRDLVENVRRIHKAGLQVQGGFIVGFDSDSPSIFDRLTSLIEDSGIVTAMVGILQALPGTKLFERMESAGRIEGSSSGDNVDGSTNIKTRMRPERLRTGYLKLLERLYSPGRYYDRVRRLLRDLPSPVLLRPQSLRDLYPLFRSFLRLGVIGRERLHYWRLLIWTLLRCRWHLPLAVTLAIYGHHFRMVVRRHVAH
jgi:radical SAM superfamily enzyme YgiQ (UPF0313 family)